MRLRPLKAKFEFKLQDLWIGVFWKKGTDRCSYYDDKNRRPVSLAPERLDIWICLIPCLPLHLKFGGNETDHPFLRLGREAWYRRGR
jgi:hypothetical protein